MSTDVVQGRLVRRYKRFLADVILNDGTEVTVHCPNTGSMKNCAEEGARVWLSVSDNPKRKYAMTWESLETSSGFKIGINTGRANLLVRDGIRRDFVPELTGYEDLRTEVRYGRENSRIDLLLSGEGKSDCYVEVKSVTLLESPLTRGRGYFPDSVSERGTRHLRELMAVAAEGHRAVLFFCVQHSGIRSVAPADHIDPVYGKQLRCAIQHGVEVLVYRVRFWRGVASRVWKPLAFEPMSQHVEH